MAFGRPLQKLVLSADEAAKLAMMARRPKSHQRTALRTDIVLDCASGMSNTAVAKRHEVTLATVGKWRQRFLAQRLAGLGDAPRPGQPRKLTDAKIEAVVTRTLEKKPVGTTHWSTRSMAKAKRDDAKRHRAHLARIRAEAASAGELQALERSALRREGA